MATEASTLETKLTGGAGKGAKIGMLVFGVALVIGFIYAGTRLGSDLAAMHSTEFWPFVLLGIALLVALGFEFVNGFHDTANAVATVIYTHSMEPHVAVVWSGAWNFVGVLISSGAVAFTIVGLLPVELILQVGGRAGFAMVFALLIAAIIWNIGTWLFGLPASSTHTMVGSIIGIGIANQLMAPKGVVTSGVDWSQAMTVGKSLLISPLVGFGVAAILLLLCKALIPNKQLYEAPKGTEPPPFWIRALLVLTCTGVSFAHGSNDGQKGMGLIMLILIGTVPTAYALNHAVTPADTQDFIAVSNQMQQTLDHYVPIGSALGGDPREWITDYLRTKEYTPNTLIGMKRLTEGISSQLDTYKDMNALPHDMVRNVRNDMYVANEGFRLMLKSGNPKFTAEDTAVIKNYQSHIDKATRFIPTWVKVAVALALGMGTMIGWKRIVVTVGEKIGKDHLTYGQGAAAEITAMATIMTADSLHLPVSTTHVLSSGVAGTMAANRSGLQLSTVRNLALAWVLTLPASMILSATLFWLFRSVVG